MSRPKGVVVTIILSGSGFSPTFETAGVLQLVTNSRGASGGDNAVEHHVGHLPDGDPGSLPPISDVTDDCTGVSGEPRVLPGVSMFTFRSNLLFRTAAL